MQIRIPELQRSLPLKPPLTYQQAVHHARLVIIPSRFPCRSAYLACYNGRIGFCDLPFFELAGNDLLDLILEAECNFGDFDGGEGRADRFALGKDWRADYLVRISLWAYRTHGCLFRRGARESLRLLWSQTDWSTSPSSVLG